MKPLSWTELYLYTHDHKRWYDRYILGNEDEPTSEMRLGTCVHKVIERPELIKLAIQAVDESFPVDKARNIKRLLYKARLLHPKQSEVVIRAKLRDSEGIYEGVSLIAIFDGFYKKERILREFKTTDLDKKWLQYRVNTSEQLSFYAYCYWLNTRKFFREIQLYRLNTENANIKKFETQRGWMDIMQMEQKIKAVIDAMVNEGLWYKRISSQELKKKKEGQLILIPRL
jgi:hypothetical protein